MMRLQGVQDNYHLCKTYCCYSLRHFETGGTATIIKRQHARDTRSPQKAFLTKQVHLSRAARGKCTCKAVDEEGPQAWGANRWTLLAGAAALILALGITGSRDDIADALYDEGLRGSGDTLAAVLWAISLYFCTPWQTLLIFLGRVDTERPSDWLLNFLANRVGLDTSGDDFSYPLALRIVNVVLFAVGGTAVAQGLSSALGDATWSLSTGLGSCLIAGIYEVGRPERLSSEEANQLDAQYRDFVQFADERLQPRGSCHETEIFSAFRRSDARYRTEEALSDLTLRRFIRSWAKQYVYPTAERTSSGFFKRISLREQIDPFTGASTGTVSEKTR